MKTKICTKCNIEKKLSAFYKHKMYKDGIRSYCKACDRIYQIENQEKISKRQKDYRLNNKEKTQLQRRNNYLKNKEKILKCNEEYRQKNKNKINKTLRLLYNKKILSDIIFKITKNLRTRIWYALKRNQKSKKTIKLLGCSINRLKQHLEDKFSEGMSWDNYGKWHVDHIQPCASFDLSKQSEQLQCFNYTNLQPLWAIDNIKKGCKVI